MSCTCGALLIFDPETTRTLHQGAACNQFRRKRLDARYKEIQAELAKLYAEQDAIDDEIERMELAEQAELAAV